MGDLYEIGVTLGLGLAAGVFLAGVLAAWREGWVVSVLGAAVIGLVAGLLVKDSLGAGGGVVGGVVGALSAGVIVRGALRSGATPGGAAFILISAAVAIALVALIPAAGYVMVVLLPILAVRRSRREPKRHAGLRILSK